jgi:hypothetical protein
MEGEKNIIAKVGGYGFQTNIKAPVQNTFWPDLGLTVPNPYSGRSRILLLKHYENTIYVDQQANKSMIFNRHFLLKSNIYNFLQFST